MEKSLKELYSILLNKIDYLNKEPTETNYKYFNDDEKGICDLISFLSYGYYWINVENSYRKLKKDLNYNESNILYKDFIKRKPKWYNSKFWWNLNFNKFSNNGYWWKCNIKGNNQRKLFIESIIKKL